MYDFLNREYNIRADTSIRLTNKTIRIKSSQSQYILKEVDNNSLETLYNRLSIIHMDYFVLPIENVRRKYVTFDDNKYYVLYRFFENEDILGIDLKLSFFIKALAMLHKKTSYYININDNYLESTLNYLDEQIKNISNDIQARIEVIERSDYHSPNDWYFLMHYNQLQNAVENASKHVLNFENLAKKEKSLRICLTYQNFDFNHILLKNEQIISIEKMGYNMAPFDLYDLLNKCDLKSINMIPYIKEYLVINPLNEYEKEYLMAMLYIISYHRYENQKQDLEKMISLVDYIGQIDNIENEVIFASPSEE